MAIRPKLILLLLTILVSFSFPSSSASRGTRLMSAFSSDDKKEDPEVVLCRQQCVRQWQFSPTEMRVCNSLCDEYGREKEERQREGGGAELEEIERQRERCNHQCRVAQLDEGEEKKCREKCEEQYWEERRKLQEDQTGLYKTLRWVVHALYDRA